jgi:hypothetical protein
MSWELLSTKDIIHTNKNNANKIMLFPMSLQILPIFSIKNQSEML